MIERDPKQSFQLLQFEMWLKYLAVGTRCSRKRPLGRRMSPGANLFPETNLGWAQPLQWEAELQIPIFHIAFSA